jgi:hypothetical protein
MKDLKVDVKLDHIHCYDEGDGPGDAEPYLWAVYFKVDGETVVVNTDGPAAPFLQGPPTVSTTPGNHGNLYDTDVDEGDDVPIPAVIGEWHSTLKPIPLTTPILGRTEVGGLLGCIVVLMEEDFTDAAAIAQGHDALNSSVRDQLAAVMSTISVAHQEPTDAEIDALSDQVADAVKNAIGEGVSVLSWIGGWGNMDDEIGSAVFRFSHSQLEGMGGAPLPFGRRWDNEGDWEIFGSITATALPDRDTCCRDLLRRVERLEKELLRHRIREVEQAAPATVGRRTASAAAAATRPASRSRQQAGESRR